MVHKELKPFFDGNLKDEVLQHNKQVSENRQILRRLIDSICFLAKQEIPLRGHNESADSMNKGNYIEILQYLRNFDPLLNGHLASSSIFQGTSATIQNDIIKAIYDVVIDVIKAEINSAEFVAIMLDETSDVMCKSQLSTVLRYVKEDAVFERFIGFTDVSRDKTANALFDHVQNIVKEFKINNKLIGQTYDGASVMSGHLNGLQTKVVEAYPLAMFTHCYAHVLNLVLQQSLMHITECKVFFQTLNGVAAFFPKSSKRTAALSEFCAKKMPSVAPTRWNFTSRLSNTVHEYRESLMQFFESIIEDVDDKWDNDTIVKARGFVHFLNDYKTKFFLEVFSKVFRYTDVLYDILQSKSFDIMYCSKKIIEIVDHLKLQRSEEIFEEFWSKSNENDSELIELLSQKRGVSLVERKTLCRKNYYEIIDGITMQIDLRFKSFSNLSFFHLISYENFNEYKENFPEDIFKKLKTIYGNLFDYVSLKNELSVLYMSSDMSGKPVYELFHFMFSKKLQSGFCELYKLIKLILTLPATTASVERSFSALKRIHTYKRATQTQERLNRLSLFSIEKQLLNNLMSLPTFYDDVISKFLCQKRRLELTYR